MKCTIKLPTKQLQIKSYFFFYFFEGGIYVQHVSLEETIFLAAYYALNPRQHALS